MAGILLTILLVLILLVYWQFILAEGTYLGRSIVAKLYDWTAGRYDRIKAYNVELEDATLGRPLAAALEHVPHPLVLDVATGTGRLPMSLLRQPAFRGTVVGLDLSAGMLAQARRNLAEHAGRVHLVQGDACRLPFPDAAFHAVTCLEALEFMPHPRAALAEMTRVLKPGGWILFTNRIGWEARFLPGKVFPRRRVASVLQGLPLEEISEMVWEVNYDQVWARRQA